MLKLFFLAIINSACNTLANSFWKYQFEKQPLDTSSFIDIVRTSFNINVILGILFYCGSMLTFFYLLSNYKLSTVVPILSVNYILNLLVAGAFFKESISSIQIVGVAIILTGIFVYSRGIN